MWAGWNVCAALYVDGCEASAQNVGIDLSFLEYYGFLLTKSVWTELCRSPASWLVHRPSGV